MKIQRGKPVSSWLMSVTGVVIASETETNTLRIYILSVYISYIIESDFMDPAGSMLWTFRVSVETLETLETMTKISRSEVSSKFN